MLCDKCQKNLATVHLSRVTSALVEVGLVQERSAHYCATCAAGLEHVGVRAKSDRTAVHLRLQVISVTPEVTILHQLWPEPETGMCERSFRTSRLPPQYAVEGYEFELRCSRDELEHLQYTNEE
jgi:protein-arginine kinase activator protein McsA